MRAVVIFAVVAVVVAAACCCYRRYRRKEAALLAALPPTSTRKDVFGRVLFEVETTLRRQGITRVIPMFGTLLGFVRDGDFLCYDEDIDIGVYGTRDQVVRACATLRREHQYVIEKGPFGGWVQVLHVPSKVHVDIVVLKNEGRDANRDLVPLARAYYAMKKDEHLGMPLDALLPLARARCRRGGAVVDMPADPARILTMWYGDGWTRPDTVCDDGCNKCTRLLF